MGKITGTGRIVGTRRIIASVTDLHPDANPSKISKCANKMALALKKKAKAFFMTGDIFTLTGEHWAILREGIKSEAQRKEMEAFSRVMVDSGAPLLIDAAGGLPIYIIKGNGDDIGYEYMQKAFPGKFIFVQNTSPISFYSRFVLGQGGIPAAPGNKNIGIPQNSPWYRGVMFDPEYDALINNSATPNGAWSWVQTIWMTHMPAFGHVDAYKGEHQGSKVVLDFIRRKYPLIHLAGHVHDGATIKIGETKTYKPFSVIDNKTLSVNAGSPSDEVNMVLINPDLVYEFRIDGTLEQRAEECISIVP